MTLTPEMEESIRRCHASHVAHYPDCEVCCLLRIVDELRRENADVLSLSVEVAHGITHSAACGDPGPCLRCQLEQERNRSGNVPLGSATRGVIPSF